MIYNIIVLPYYHLQSGLLKSTTKGDVCNDDSINTIKSLSQLLVEYQSSSILNNKDNTENKTLNFDFTSALKYLLEDLKEKTCDWVCRQSDLIIMLLQ